MSVQLVNGYVMLPKPCDWSNGAEIVLVWQTEIATAKRGYEDRASLRSAPQAQFSWRVVTLTPAEGAELEDQVRAALRGGQACAPCWARPSYTTAIAGDGLAVYLEPTQWGWAAGDYLLALDASGTPYVSQVAATAGLRLTLSAAVPTTAGIVWPLLFGRLETEQPEQEAPDALSLNLRLYINAWRPPAALVAPVAVYQGVPLPPGDIATDWGDQVNRSFAYDPSVEQIGFGTETLEIEQSYVQHGFELSTVLTSDGEISDFESFFSVLGGRRGGFFLPSPERAMVITGSLSRSSFLIQNQSLTQTWGSQPDQYLYFRSTTQGRAAQMGRMTGVLDAGNGNEEVTLDAALNTAVDASWDVYRLRLLRLADDKVTESYDADGYATIRVNVVELPLEYFSAAPVVPQPVYLYRFNARLNANVTWLLTSHSANVVYNGETYLPAAISHGEIKRAMDGTDEKVTLTTSYTANSPLAIYLPFPPSDRLRLVLRRLDLGAANPAATAAILFQGFVSAVKMMGRKLEATVQSPIDFLDRKLPGVILGTPCNAQLYGPGCNLNMADWVFGSTFNSLNGTLLYTNSMPPGVEANYFAGGRLITGAGATLETRTIMSSGDDSAMYVVINYPLIHAVVGQAVALYPGCSHLPADCTGKFDNFVNYQGHPLVPYRNPTLRAIDVNSDGSGKK